jgi:succinate dehydrogenase / fumarate reductase, cytochrome b subunit
MATATDVLGGERKQKHALIEFLASSIGAKVLMAFSGAGLWLYLILHAAGNLPVLWDRASFNHYAHLLQSTPILLWTERVLVFGGMVVHAFMGYRLTKLNRDARGHDYALRDKDTSTFASRSMIISGTIILAFFVYHILHFTVRAVGGATFATEKLADGTTQPDAALMVSSAFSSPLITGFYVLAIILVFVHLYHGSVSLFQSLGLFRLFRSANVRMAVKAIVIGVAAAFVAVPIFLFLRG